MTFHHLYKINCLEIHIPIKITENMYLLPRKEVLNDKNYQITFNKEEYSYLFILSENREDVPTCDQNRIEMIKSVLSLLLANQFYTKEFMHLYFEDSQSTFLKAKITPNLKISHQKREDLAHFNIVDLFTALSNIYKHLCDHFLADYIFKLTSTLMAFLRENVFELSVILGTTFIEHLTAVYWTIKDPEYLTNLKDDTFNKYITHLSKCAQDFIDNKLKVDEILLKGNYKNPSRVKSILKQNLSPNVNNFSPAKFRFFSLLEHENLEKMINKEQIKDLFEVRNGIIHDGRNYEDFLSMFANSPFYFLEIMKNMLYRFFLQFLKIVRDHFEFEFGRLILKEKLINYEGKTEEEIKRELNDSAERNKEYIEKIIPKMGILDEHEKLLRHLNGDKSMCTFSWESGSSKVNFEMVIDADRGEYEIRIFNPPLNFIKYWNSTPFQANSKYPDENIRVKKPYAFKYSLENYAVNIESYNIGNTNVDFFKMLFGPKNQEYFMHFLISEININLIH